MDDWNPVRSSDQCLYLETSLLFAIERKLQLLIFHWCEDMWGPSISLFLIVPNCNDKLDMNSFIYIP